MDMYVDDVNNKFKVDLFTESLSCITFDIFTDSLYILNPYRLHSPCT